MVPEVKKLSDVPPTLEEAQEFVGGYVQMLTLRDGSQMLINEDGRVKRLPPNVEATILAEHYGPIVGSVLVLSGSAKWK
jgi:hypothetical protein